MDPLALLWLAESQAEFRAVSLMPTFPLARALYAKDNHIPAEMEEANHGE